MKCSDSRYSGCLYFASNALARKMEKLANASWKKAGLPVSHAYLLMSVIENPGIQPIALCGQLQLSPSTITRLVEKLEEKRLVVRTTEGKITNIYPTPRAKEMLPLMKSCVKEFALNWARMLGQEEGFRLARNINRISDKLED